MQDIFKLDATKRTDVGKGASRRLRHAGKVPAIIYGAGKDPQSINLDHIAFGKSLDNEAFYSHVLTLNVEGKTEKVILRDLQRHPFKVRILHADFQRVSDKEKLTMRVPLHFVGGDLSPGVKLSGGVVSHLVSEVEVECLPANLPEYLEVDLSHLELNQMIHLADIKLPAGVDLIDLLHNDNKSVVTVYVPRAAEEKPIGEAVAASDVPATASSASEAGKKGE